MLIAFVRTASLESSRSRRCLVWSGGRFSRGREAEALDCSRYRDVAFSSDGSKIPSLVSKRTETMDEIRNEFSHLRFVFDNLNRCTIGLITGEKFFAMINIL